MAGLSKTARASVAAGEGNVKRQAVAWIFRRLPNGGKQTRPFRTFYVVGEAEQWIKDVVAAGADAEDYYAITAQSLNQNTQRR